MNLTEHFTLEELDNPPAHLQDNAYKVAHVLEVIRLAANSPIIVTSGYRSEAHNRAIGGKPNSLHLLALAADFRALTGPYSEVQRLADLVESLIRVEAIPDGGLGRSYPKHIHYDLGRGGRRW